MRIHNSCELCWQLFSTQDCCIYKYSDPQNPVILNHIFETCNLSQNHYHLESWFISEKAFETKIFYEHFVVHIFWSELFPLTISNNRAEIYQGRPRMFDLTNPSKPPYLLTNYFHVVFWLRLIVDNTDHILLDHYYSTDYYCLAKLCPRSLYCS